jgi:hypothetical protein
MTNERAQKQREHRTNKIVNNKIPLGQIVDEHSYDELKANHINPISIKREKIQNEYQ